jgi:signal transduction histidine kinase
MNPNFLVLIGIGGMLCLSIGIILFVVVYTRRVIKFRKQRQVELLQASIQSEEEERMRIAAELHDDVGATLSAALLYLYRATLTTTDNRHMQQATDLVNQSIQKIRDLSQQLQPGTLRYLGLQKSLQSLAELISRSDRIRVEFEENELWPATDTNTELSLYRIIQELINNINKHSQATFIKIVLNVNEVQSYVSVIHDGNGLTEESYYELLHKKGALGLKNIENRLKSANLKIVFPKLEESLYAVQLFLPAAIPGK